MDYPDTDTAFLNVRFRVPRQQFEQFRRLCQERYQRTANGQILRWIKEEIDKPSHEDDTHGNR